MAISLVKHHFHNKSILQHTGKGYVAFPIVIFKAKYALLINNRIQFTCAVNSQAAYGIIWAVGLQCVINNFV